MADNAEALKVKLEKLRADISACREEKKNCPSFDESCDVKSLAVLKNRRQLKGHFGKVYAMHWAGSGGSASNSANKTGDPFATELVSASQDGKLIVWDAYTTCKVQAIPLRSSWVMTCAFEQSQNDVVACGGLDNLCSIYDVRNPANTRAKKELSSHDGYLSCCRFRTADQIITSSGDSTCILWDVSKGDTISHFTDHGGDVMSVAIHPTDKNVFISGSCDASAKLWDIRDCKCQKTFKGHDSDINAVSFFPDGNAFGTGSDDSTCRLFDIRAFAECNQFHHEQIVCGITSIVFSKSGRAVFAGYDDYAFRGWSINSKEMSKESISNNEAQNRVSCMGVSQEGTALCTGSWDTLLRVYA